MPFPSITPEAAVGETQRGSNQCLSNAVAEVQLLWYG
eukprot:gene12034-8287_t